MLLATFASVLLLPLFFDSSWAQGRPFRQQQRQQQQQDLAPTCSAFDGVDNVRLPVAPRDAGAPAGPGATIPGAGAGVFARPVRGGQGAGLRQAQRQRQVIMKAEAAVLNGPVTLTVTLIARSAVARCWSRSSSTWATCTATRRSGGNCCSTWPSTWRAATASTRGQPASWTTRRSISCPP